MKKICPICNGAGALPLHYKPARGMVVGTIVSVVAIDNSIRRWYDADCLLHRARGPAVKFVDGSREWWTHGTRIKMIDVHGTKRWFDDNGDLHRDGDKPATVYANGQVEYWRHGKCTR